MLLYQALTLTHKNGVSPVRTCGACTGNNRGLASDQGNLIVYGLTNEPGYSDSKQNTSVGCTNPLQQQIGDHRRLYRDNERRTGRVSKMNT